MSNITILVPGNKFKVNQWKKIKKSTSGVAPAARTVATATDISAADSGSKGWQVWALVMTGIPMPGSKQNK